MQGVVKVREHAKDGLLELKCNGCEARRHDEAFKLIDLEKGMAWIVMKHSGRMS